MWHNSPISPMLKHRKAPVLFSTFPAAALSIFTFLLLTAPTKVTSCAQVCSCGIHAEVVTCSGGQVVEILEELPPGVQKLTLDGVLGLHTVRPDLVEKMSRSSLEKLEIVRSSVTNIEPEAFQSLPALKELDLSMNKLLTLGQDTFTGLSALRVLNLSGNHLSSLGEALYAVPTLENLDVSYNSLQDLPAGVFSAQTLLTYLRLNGNTLRNLYGHSFQGLDKVTELKVRDCSLFYIREDVYDMIPKLKILDLGENRLSIFPVSALLKRFKFLKVVLFDNNEVQALQENHFSGLYLNTLNLARNHISSIDIQTFHDSRLQEVDLSYNRILSLKRAILQPLGDHLISLTLAGNELKELEPFVFGDLKLLETLNISSCSLDTLHYDVLKDLPRLKRLDISHNNLHYLPQEILNLFEKLYSVNLHENSWICDCQIKPLFEWSRQASSASKTHCPASRTMLQDCSSLRCVAPSEFYHKRLSSLEDSKLQKCENDDDDSDLPQSTQWAIVASCFGFAFILLAITIYLWRRGKTRHGLKRICVPSAAQSSHVIDEDAKVPPLSNCDRDSLNESDHSFVFRHYFDQMVTDPKLMSRTSDSEEPTTPKERDSLYSSQPSLYSAHSITIGIESTV